MANVCAQCGVQIDGNHKYCESCAAELVRNRKRTAPAEPVEPQKEYSSPFERTSKPKNCSKCGAPLGGNRQFCDKCVEEMINAEGGGRNRKGSLLPGLQPIPLTERRKTHLILGGAGLATMYYGIFLFAPVHSAAAAFYFSGVIVSLFSFLASYAILITNMMVHDTMWGIVSLIVPGMAYRYVAIRPEQARLPIIINIVGGIALAAFGFALASSENIGFPKALDMVKEFIHWPFGDSGVSF